MLRELESPGLLRIVMYVVVLLAVAVALFVRTEADAVVLSHLQGALAS